MSGQSNGQSKYFGFNLRTARERKELTQHELALIVGSQSRSITRWETGRHVPRRDMRRRLADALDMTVEDLLRAPDEDSEPVAA